jgi:uncharacterized protein YeeX (DUF496 family)
MNIRKFNKKISLSNKEKELLEKYNKCLLEDNLTEEIKCHVNKMINAKNQWFIENREEIGEIITTLELNFKDKVNDYIADKSKH